MNINTSLDNSLELLLNKMIDIVTNIILPIGILSDTISISIQQNKTKLIVFVFMLILIGCAGFNSVLSGSTDNNLENIDQVWVPEFLRGYVEPGFDNSYSPVHSPFGGILNQYSIVTSYFHDTNYFNVYHRWHEGMDLIPNNNYYLNNQAYQKRKETVLFATCTGNAISSIDSQGANYIYLLCADNRYAVFYVHNKYNFIPRGEKSLVFAGQPIAVMGSTGNSTGAHVHYAIKDIIISKYINPIVLINH